MRGEGRRFGAIGGIGLVQDVSNVVADSSEADEQFFGDLPVGFTRRDQSQDFYFPLGQPGGVGGGSDRSGLGSLL